MQRDIELNDIDWVYCWRTSTGDVEAGSRETSASGSLLPYRPDGVGPGRGLRTIARGRVRTCPLPPTGPRLDGQGLHSRAAAFAWGHVIRASIVPATTDAELQTLIRAARAAVQRGEAGEWALAAVHAWEGVRWGVHVGASWERDDDSLRPVLGELAASVGAVWTLRVDENLIAHVDREGGRTQSVGATSVFDDAPLPAFAIAEPDRARESSLRGPAGEIQYQRPIGADAWERWLEPSGRETS